MSQHAERVFESVSSGSAAVRSKVAASWWRSYQVHGIDPGDRNDADGPDTSRLKEQREASGRLLHVARPRLTELYGLVASFGGGVFLTDHNAFVLAGRTHDAQSDAFRGWGLEAGRDWSEATQGTNGIGTCIAEARALVIHRDEHFKADNIGMSCIDAPIFGPDGKLAGALDVSSARGDQTENLNQLILAMVTRLACLLEADLFRDHFSGARIVVAGDETNGAQLFAVDRNDILLGATRAARRTFGLPKTGLLPPQPLRDLTGEAAAGFVGAERGVVLRALTRADGNMSAAARELGIGRATLYRRMKRLGIGENPGDVSHR